MPAGRFTNEGVLCNVRAFIADCCGAGPGFFTSNAELFAAWRAWAYANGKTPAQGLCLSASRFGQVFGSLCRVGAVRGRHREGGKLVCGWWGLMLPQSALDLPTCPKAELVAVIDAWVTVHSFVGSSDGVG